MNQVVSPAQRRYASHRTARWSDHRAPGHFQIAFPPPPMSRPRVLAIGIWLVQLLRGSHVVAAMRHTTRLLNLLCQDTTDVCTTEVGIQVIEV